MSNIKKTRLAPCPFCGSKNVELNIYEEQEGWKDSITCPACGIGFTSGWFGPGMDIEDVEKMSALAWNTRKETKDEK